MLDDGVQVEPAVAELPLSELTKLYRARFQSLEKEYAGMFQQLDGSLGRLSVAGLSARQREDFLLDSEYLIVRLRSRLLSEVSSINTILAVEQRPLVVDMFKARMSTLTSYFTRLNELRADCEVVQRTRYVDSFRRG